MTTLDERYPDLLRDQLDPAARRLVHDLDTVCAATTAPASLRATLARTLEQRTTRRGQHMPRPWPSLQGHVASLAVMLALALSGALAYLGLLRPAPASAQLILQRAVAAARHLAPHQAVHLVYRLADVPTDSGRITGTIDVWIQTDAHGTPVLLAQTETRRCPDGTTITVDRRVLRGPVGQDYSAQDNTIRLVTADPQGPSLFISGAAYFSAFAQGPDQRVRLLAPRRLDGIPVAVVRVDPRYAPSYTLYFDAHSYVLRGMDIADGRGGQGRLIAAARVPAAAVPPHTFTLNAPATAHVAPHEAVVAAAADLTAIDHPALALVSICNIPPGVL
jgi:hypothetical protein